MDERTVNLNKFYNEDCDEEERLLSKHGSIEFTYFLFKLKYTSSTCMPFLSTTFFSRLYSSKPN